MDVYKIGQTAPCWYVFPFLAIWKNKQRKNVVIGAGSMPGGRYGNGTTMNHQDWQISRLATGGPEGVIAG